MKTIFQTTILTAATLTAGEFTNLETQAHSAHHGRHSHSGHHLESPIGVMASHTHKTGQWMLSYRYMFMRMEQNFVGDSTVPDSTVLSDFIVSPQDMDMQMHMLGIMFAPTDRLTLMGMLNYVETSMAHINRMGVNFTTESTGFGDSSLGGLYKLFETDSQNAHFGLMALLPTADIDNKDNTPLGFSQLPYPMQSGSGSWGLNPSLTWNAHLGHWSLGSQVSAKFYLADNDNDYQLGNRYEGTLWAGRHLTNWLSTTVRLNLAHWEDIEGADPNITTTAAPMGTPLPLVPTADTALRGGTRLDFALGASLTLPKSQTRLALEIGTPIYQNLDGPQLGIDWFATAGLQFAF
ncbi:MAG: transporter [Verrucomicrobiota bacterium]